MSSTPLIVLICALGALLGAMIYLWFKQLSHNTELRTTNAVLEDRLATQESEQLRLESVVKREREELSEQFSKNFSIMASEIVEQKSRSMNITASETIGGMLKPLGDNLREFRERIEIESRHRFALESEVKRLAELNIQISRQAQNLSDAMRSNSKAQGDWGEMILETLLENSGLKRGIHFRTQENLKSETGTNLRPDVILSLPEGKEVIIDSKVSLTAYINHTETEDAESARRALALHVLSIKNHISELGAKRYDRLLGTSPDFVIMFVPTEPALLLALQTAPELWSEAYAKGVILSSPSNLFGILRIVDDLWRRDTQSKNAIEIARQGGDLYDKFVLFAENFAEVGRAIDKSADLFEKTKKQLNQGAGNLVRRTEKLRELGVKTSKKMPIELSSAEDESEYE